MRNRERDELEGPRTAERMRIATRRPAPGYLYLDVPCTIENLVRSFTYIAHSQTFATMLAL